MRVVLYGEYPVLHIASNCSSGESRLAQMNGSAVDIGADFFALAATDAWSRIRESKSGKKADFEVLIDDVVTLSCAVSLPVAHCIRSRHGVLIVADLGALNEGELLSGDVDGFLIGTWDDKPFK